jgi:putative endopeptidase
MRRIVPALLSLVVCVSLTAQQRGVFVEDIDKTVNACTNFFDYANGAWRKANPIPNNMTRWSRRWETGERNKNQLQAILEDLSKTRGQYAKGSIEQQITDFYGACMDTAAINAAGVKPIAPLLAEIDAMKSRAAIQPMIGKLHDLSVNIPFGVGGSPDNHNPSEVIARVYASGLGMPNRDYYVNTDARMVEARQKYLEHIARMFELAGSPKADAEAAARTVFAFESRLATAHFTNVERRNPKLSDNKVTPAALQAMTPSFSWATYFKRNRVALETLNVDQPKFMAALEEELKSAPLSTWKLYLKWHVINDAASHLSDPFVEEQFAFRGRYLGGAKEMKPRATRCVETTDQLLGEPLGQKYVELHFPPAAKARMEDMVRNLLAAMGDTIRGLDWMSDTTKTQALEKLSTFKPKIGYPDHWRDHSSIAVSGSSHFRNLMNATRFHIADDRAQIGKPIDRSRWGMTPPTSNAYYNPLMNEIVFPAGILQPPAFDVNASDAVNYGAIGVVIGHEISHGFDDQGSQYDALGRLRNWWTADDLARFKERSQCVVDQFEGYFIEPGVHHNGKLVLGESIGDLAGAKIAYLGLQKAQAKTPGQTIDGFTPDQQFFIAWGQFRGDEIRQESQRLMVQNGPHPTGKYRVIGPLSNMPEFAKAFGCAPDSEMVRKTQCVVW